MPHGSGLRPAAWPLVPLEAVMMMDLGWGRSALGIVEVME
jgi:hypothetical protein